MNFAPKSLTRRGRKRWKEEVRGWIEVETNPVEAEKRATYFILHDRFKGKYSKRRKHK